MWTLMDLIENFFTHKDFLPPASQIPGTMFTPMQLGASAFNIAIIALCCLWMRKRQEKTVKTVYGVLWALCVVLEIAKILWETYSGKMVRFEVTGVLPLYPCSIFMYAMPLAIWGKGWVRTAGCGYVCSLGLLGGMVNFVYPATVMNNYSCLSFAGWHTQFYHGVLVFCALSMLLSGYHSYQGITKPIQLLIPAVPALAVSVIANVVNFSPLNTDYMFFKLSSFFFAPIGAATPDWLSVIMVYGLYLLIHALPYLPSYLTNRMHSKQKA